MKKFQKINDKKNIQTIKAHLNNIGKALNNDYRKMHKLPGLKIRNKILINKTTQENYNLLNKICQSINNMLDWIRETVSHMTYSEIAKIAFLK